MSLLMWLVGILTGIGGLLLYQKIKSGRFSFKAYHWVALAIWYLAGLFVIGFIGTSLVEGEPQAAGMATLIFGGAFLVFSIVVYRFAFFKRTAENLKETQGQAL